MAALCPALARAQNGNAFDIGIVIDNRPLPRDDVARADVDALVTMLDQQMYIEHIMVFERPSIQVICSLFGCPQAIDVASAFPSLIWQITREDEARLLLYYIGDGRAEGLERQLLFKRRDHSPEHDVVGLPVDWLHGSLAEASPKSAVLMLDTSFAPTRLPCAGDDPALINDALLSMRRNYRHIMRDHRLPDGHLELSATTPLHANNCDRLDQMLGEAERPLFTKFLLEGVVEGEADREPFGDEDRLVDLGELSDYLNERIRRTVRFQGGLPLSVRAAGSRSRPLASVDRRRLGSETADIIERRNRRPEPAVEQQATAVEAADRPTAPQSRAARCLDDPAAEDCHPCVLEPGGRACAERCQQDQGSDLCAQHLISGTDDDIDTEAGANEGPGGITVVPREERQPNDGADQRSAACRWTSDQISPYATTLVRRVSGGTETACAWAMDRSEVGRGPLAQLFTPVAWRLGRSTAQDALACLLDCTNSVTPPVETVQAPPPSEPARPAQPAQPAGHQRQAWVDPRTLGPLEREVCDRLHEPLPPYIGLPRWMPGTLIVSEAMRQGYDCPPPPDDPVLPVPPAVAIEPPDNGEPPVEPESDDEITEPDPPVENVPEDEPPVQAEEPFTETRARVRWLQRALTVDNRSPGPIDGIIGEKTMAAVQSWRLDNGRADRQGALTEDEFRQIIEEFAKRFGQIESDAASF